jgi:hypothetical protein
MEHPEDIEGEIRQEAEAIQDVLKNVMTDDEVEKLDERLDRIKNLSEDCPSLDDDNRGYQ